MKALTIADSIHSKTNVFRDKVDKTRKRIEEILTATSSGQRCAVTVSGGKDSTVLLHLFRSLYTDIRAVNFCVKEAESKHTLDLLLKQKVEYEPIEGDFIMTLKKHGYWGYNGPLLDSHEKEIDFFRLLILDPCKSYCQKNDIICLSMGLRGRENKGRRINWRKRGYFYYTEGLDEYHAIPLGDWSTDDIWAYISAYGLEYNVLYDKMAAIGIGREEQRVSLWFGDSGSNIGRLAIWRQIEPETFNVFAHEFPLLKQYY